MEHNEQIKDLMADKLALDQMYAKCIQELHLTKKNLLLKENQLADIMKQNSDLLAEKEEWKKPQVCGTENANVDAA